MRKALLWFLVVTLSGCATYKQSIDEGLNLAKEGNWAQAESTLEPVLNNPQDQLLYYLEIGTLAQNQGDYERSNDLLEQAEALSDTFLKDSFSNRSWSLTEQPKTKQLSRQRPRARLYQLLKIPQLSRLSRASQNPH
ncbi:hypothetical protein [Marinomonas sp. GJ51-6]|uniref:hypothetical protein n=1 Tax=Marinomonas sp. GJ51-6 TaxID=2992802 RepID=UPI00293416E5|nr:hypothetical protein [Marinomonas sp. GJ51-6]WOD06047.1 hypothetical protein ONZ50_09815 [Marinomonas sp. GJ51-6]